MYSIFMVHENLEFHGVTALLAEVTFPDHTFLFKSCFFFQKCPCLLWSCAMHYLLNRLFCPVISGCFVRLYVTIVCSHLPLIKSDAYLCLVQCCICQNTQKLMTIELPAFHLLFFFQSIDTDNDRSWYYEACFPHQ